MRGRSGARCERARLAARGRASRGRHQLRLERRIARRHADGLGDARSRSGSSAAEATSRGRSSSSRPPRDLALADHVRAGAAVTAACSGRRAAIVASADHGHAHDPDGPFGFDPAAAEYDARVVDLVRENRLAQVVDLDSIVDAASADSLWQLVLLHGALADGFDAELLSYECPTYFGMLCAAFEPRDP